MFEMAILFHSALIWGYFDIGDEITMPHMLFKSEENASMRTRWYKKHQPKIIFTCCLVLFTSLLV